jgi:hypothetical protein
MEAPALFFAGPARRCSAPVRIVSFPAPDGPNKTKRMGGCAFVRGLVRLWRTAAQSAFDGAACARFGVRIAAESAAALPEAHFFRPLTRRLILPSSRPRILAPAISLASNTSGRPADSAQAQRGQISTTFTWFMMSRTP